MSASSLAWMERHRELKARAEELVAKARTEIEAGKRGVTQGSRAAQLVSAQRKLKDVSRVLLEMDKLSQENLRPGDEQLRIQVQSDISDLQRQRKDVIGATQTRQAPPTEHVEARETVSTKPLSDQELMRQQYAGLEAQDAALDRMEPVIGRIQAQFTSVGTEVREQNRIVDSLDYDMEAEQSRLQVARNKVEEYLMNRNRRLFYTLCFLVPFFITLLVIHLIRMLL